MATDVSIRFGVDGEKEFRSALNGINSQIKNLDSEMKAVISSMDGMDDAEEKAAKQTDILGRSIEATKQKISVISKEYNHAKSQLDELGEQLNRVEKEFGENSTEAKKAQNAYNRQAKVVNDLGTQLNNATTDLNRMEKEMRDIESGADKAGDAVKEMGKDVENTGSSLRDAFVGGAIAGGVQSLISGISELVDSTTEYRKIMGTLEVSSEKAGYTADETAESYRKLYGVIGDDQQSATALANLQALGVSQDQLTQFVDGAIGAWATYGNSIPIDSLAEAINETIQAGTVTGTFADVLNWAGTNEDEFNEKLAACGTESERANLVLQELADQGLIDAADGWRENNESIVKANEAQADMNEVMGDTSEKLSPLVTQIKEGLAGALETLQPALQFIIDNAPVIIAAIAGIAAGIIGMNFSAIIGAIAGIGPAVAGIVSAIGGPVTLIVAAISGIVAAVITLWNTNEGFREAVLNIWEHIKSAFQIAWKFIKSVWDQVKPYFQAIWDGIKITFSTVASILGGFFSAAWSAIKVVWDAVVSFFSAVWNGIKAVFSVVQAVLSGDFSAAKDAIQNVWSGITSFFSDIWGKIKGVFSNAFEAFKGIGADIVNGIKNGISNAWKAFTGWLSNKFSSIINIGKKVFDIGSPSKVFRDKIGLMIVRGMALGIEKGADEVLKAAETLNKKLIDKEEELVKKLEDTGLDEATKTALTNQLNVVKEFRSEYEKALADIQNSQDNMATKLREYGNLFTTVQDETGSFLELGDLKKDIAAIEQYGAALEQLKARGVSDTLLDEIVEMSVDDATAYTNKLIGMTDEQYAEYIALWEQKQAEAQEIASKFYSDELDALTNEFVDKLPEELSNVKDEMRGIGINGIQGMIDGMYSKSGTLYAAAQAIVSQAISAMRSAASIHSPSRKTAELVGVPMGEGIAAGLMQGMQESRKAIETAMLQPINRINRDDMYNAAAATINGMAATGAVNGVQTVIIPVNLNGKQVAEIIFDPLKGVAKQRGVALG